MLDKLKRDRACRSDRIAKYNQLLRIEEDLGMVATYPTALFKQAVTVC